MPDLHADLDRYGNLARVGYLADLIEVHALAKQRPIRFATIADAMKDADFKKRDLEILRDAQLADVSAEDEGNDDASEWLIAELRTRAQLLGVHYPFRLNQDQIAPHKVASQPYVEILGMTLAHAHPEVVSLPTGQVPSKDFEMTVHRFFEKEFCGRTFYTGSSRGQFSGLIASLRDKGFEAGVMGVRSKSANDDGADSIAWCWEPDKRLGQITVVVQATVGRSETWCDKASQVSPDRWKDHLGTGVPANAVLAVPHQLDQLMLRRLVGASSRPAVLDRSRLIRSSGAVQFGPYARAIANVRVDLFSQ